MKYKILRLTRKMGETEEERIYLETKRGFIPIMIQLEQTEEFKYDSSSVIGEIELPDSIYQSLKF